MLTLVTFHDKENAEAIKTRLVEAGIPAKRTDESNIQRFWFLSKPRAAHKVRVEEKDFERALAYVKQVDLNEGILNDAVRCPHCGSSQIEYPQTTRKFFIPTLIELVIATGLVPKDYYCESCQFTWPAKFEAPPSTWGGEEVDALGWKRHRATR
ncbi:MAG: hypothetical protein JWM68_2794 [Verrucomicrobiales bacterium]|nr:hypothetical protein [Verrucomicrobiales bacterium]